MAALCLQLIQKSWLKETLGSREKQRFLKEYFDIIVSEHDSLSLKEHEIMRDYKELYKLFDNIPLPKYPNLRQ